MIYILFIELGIGGAEKQLYEFYFWAKSNGLPVKLVSVFPINKKENKRSKFVTEICKIRSKSKFLRLLQILSKSHNFFKSVDKNDNNVIIYTPLFGNMILGLILKLTFNFKLVWGIRSTLTDPKQIIKIQMKLCKYFSKHCDIMISNTLLAKFQYQNLGWNPKKWHVVENTYLDSFKTLKNLNKVHEDNKIVFCILSRFIGFKNLEFTISTFVEHFKNNRDVHLKIGGYGNHKIESYIKNIAEQNPVILTFVGKVINKYKFFSDCDYVINNSLHGEGFPNVIFEGLQNNVYPICSDVGDVTRILRQNFIKIESPKKESLIKALNTAIKFEKSCRLREIFKLQKQLTDKYKPEVIHKKHYNILSNLIA